MIDPTVYKVELKSTDQTTSVFDVNQSVTDTEVFGNTILNKVDDENGSIPQGKASLKGAKYSLYYGWNKSPLACKICANIAQWDKGDND